jgi:phage terminase large subunit-like protein
MLASASIDPTGRAERVLDFVRELLKHPNSTAPDRRLVLLPWHEDAIRRIFGPVDENGNRAVKTALIEIPRGARKTSLAAVLALAATIGPEQQPNGQIIIAAKSRDQAKKCFNEVTGIVRMDPRLSAAVKISESRARMRHLRSYSALEAISSDGDNAHGATPVVAIVDELHAFSGPRGRRLWDAIETAVPKTPFGLLIVISTAGERCEGPLWELHTHAQKILSGEIVDDSFLPIIYTAPPELRWDDEEAWAAANPGLLFGSPPIEQLRAKALRARHLPAVRQAFEIFHLNRWADGTAAGWIEMAQYDEGGEAFDPATLEGRECWVGVDMSRSYDLTGICACFRDDDGGYRVLAWGFIPEETLRKRALESDVPWTQWRDEGALVVEGDRVQDEQKIEDFLMSLADRFDVREFLFDPACAARLMSRMIERGAPVVEFSQKWRLISPALQELQRAIVGGKFRHGGNPVLRWCINNAVPQYGDFGDFRLSKRKSKDSIDLAVAAAMAVGRASAAEEPVLDIYDRDDLRPEDLIFSWS